MISDDKYFYKFSSMVVASTDISIFLSVLVRVDQAMGLLPLPSSQSCMILILILSVYTK